ncbi:MAG: efflux RND transporter periplasmic adaptor subunit [Anaerolineales bacterium]|nr:efflux RND transporter periplasmic adaptor subunit [Anaerolineales bacterium]
MIEFIKKRRKIIIPVGIILVIVVLFLVFRPGAGEQVGLFQMATVERGNLTATVGATGTVRARQTATLVWQTTGTVDDVNVQIGDQARAGDVLASLSKTSLPQNIILAEAELVSAQQALEELLDSDTARAQAWIALRAAEDAYEKAYDYRNYLNYPIRKTRVDLVKQVTPYGVVDVPKTKTYKVAATEEEIAKADADLALKEAQYEDAKRTYERLADGPNKDDLAGAQARVDAAQATLNLAHLTAPFAGTVTEVNPIPGDRVSVGTIAFRIDDLSSLLVDVELSEVDINSVAVGQAVTLSFDAILGKEYQGQVIKVAQAGTVVGGVVNFTVTVELTDADEMVKPGMTAAVNIVIKEILDAMLVPNRAVRLVDGDRVVFVMGEEGKPEKVEIRLGSSSDTMSVVVGGDLQEGDQIILNPTADLTGSGPPFAQ